MASREVPVDFDRFRGDNDRGGGWVGSIQPDQVEGVILGQAVVAHTARAFTPEEENAGTVPNWSDRARPPYLGRRSNARPTGSRNQG